MISFRDLENITIDDKEVTLSMCDLKLVFLKNDKMLEAVGKIHATRLALFEGNEVDYSIVGEDYISNQFYIYRTVSLLADRFLSCVFNTINENIISNSLLLKKASVLKNLENNWEYLKNLKNVLVIDEKVLEMPYLKQIGEALSFDKYLTEIHIKGVELVDTLPFLLIILKNNKSIQRIIMECVRFNGDLNDFVQFMWKTKKFMACEWIFQECNFENSNFGTFSDAFLKYQGKITLLVVNNCSFSIKSFDSLSQSFFFSKCFHSLEALWMSGIHFSDEVMTFLIQLFGSDWLLNSKTLQTLAIIDCGVNLDFLFEQNANFDTGFINFNLSQNVFKKSPKKSVFKELSNMLNFNFSKCSFEQDSLFGLIDSLSFYKGDILKLDLSSIQTSVDGWNKLYDIMPSVIIPNLIELNWNCNEINLSNVKSIIGFLNNHKELTSLSLSDCIKSNEADIILNYFSDYFEKSNLLNLNISSSLPQTSLGKTLIVPIESLLKKSQIKLLKISGQNIGDEGLLKISQRLPLATEEFNFDGNSITTIESFVKIINILLEKHLKLFTWPESDIMPILQKTPYANRVEANSQIEVLQREYYQRYGGIIHNQADNSELNKIIGYTVGSKKTTRKRSSMHRKVSFSLSGKDTQQKSNITFRVYNDAIEALLEECNITDTIDPMIIRYESMKQKYDLEEISKHLSNAI